MARAKSSQDHAAEEEQRQHHQEDGAAGDDGPGEHLVDAEVDNIAQLAAFAGQIFPDAVEDHHRVGEGVARQGEERRDHQQGDLHVQQPEDPQDRQDVVEGGHGGAPIPKMNSKRQAM